MGANTEPKSARERVRHVGISNVQLDAVIEALDSTPASQRTRCLGKGVRTLKRAQQPIGTTARRRTEERVLHVDISDSELDAVNAALKAYTFEAASERAVDLLSGITNLNDGRKRISANEVEVGDVLVYGVVAAIEEHPGGVTFTIGGGHFSHYLDHQLRVERDGKVL